MLRRLLARTDEALLAHALAYVVLIGTVGIVATILSRYF